MILVGSWSLVGCPVYYSVLMTVLGYSEIDMGSVVIAITLKDVSEPLTYHQVHMADAAVEAAEYLWGVQIDVDDDSATGDPEGFDITYAVKLGTGGDATVTAPLSAQMVDLLAEMTVTPPVSDSVEPDIPRLVGLAGNTLYIGSDSRSWEILNPETQQDIPVSPTFRARFFARYNNPPDPATEIVDTVELIGNGTQLDSAADVSYTFIDIVEVRIDNAPVVAP